MELIAKCKKRIFKASDGWSVYVIVTEDGIERKATGNVDLSEGKDYTLTGEYKSHPKYGETFILIDAMDNSFDPKTPDGIAEFLSHNVKGIGKKMAAAIVKEYGTGTFDILDSDPHRLLEIKGITQRKLDSIMETYNANTKYRKIYVTLAPYGVTAGQIKKIADKYGDEALNIVMTNPYRLYEDISGIGFLTADQIAAKVGIHPDSPLRLRAAILYVLEEAAVDGHVYIVRDMLIKGLSKLAKISRPLGVDEHIDDLSDCGKVVQTDDGKIYLTRLHHAEKGTGKNIVRLLNANCPHNFNAKKYITNIEEELRNENPHFVRFDELQEKAVLNAASHNISVITGGPGTGKTSTIIGLIKALKMYDEDISIIQCAPTGKAAKRMTQQTGLPSATIHRLLASSEGMESDGEYLDGDVFIIDEASMIDITLMNSFLSFIPDGAKVIIIGDTDQLPSIGPGMVLSDIISSEEVPTVYLDKIYRQEGECGIIMTSQRLKNGDRHIITDSSMHFEMIDGDEEAFERIITLYGGFLEQGHTFEEIEILTPFRQNRKISAVELNKYISEHFNPNKEVFNYPPKPFKVGDRVIHTKNDYQMSFCLPSDTIPEPDADIDDIGVFNGDTGTVVSIRNINHETNGEPEDILTVRMDDGRIVFYNTETVNELDLSYATTIHKSQGSEYPIVITPVLKSQSYFLQRNLVYTAITRASKQCYIVGDKQAYYIALNKKEASQRMTNLIAEIKTNGNGSDITTHKAEQLELVLQ